MAQATRTESKDGRFKHIHTTDELGHSTTLTRNTETGETILRSTSQGFARRSNLTGEQFSELWNKARFAAGS